MKFIVGLVVGVLCTSTAFCQDSLVCIKPQVARWFLERNETLKVYEHRDSLHQELVANLNDQLLNKDVIIDTYEVETSSLRLINETFITELRLTREENKGLKRQNLVLKIGGAILLALLIVL